MADIKSPTLLFLKAGLFIAIGALAAFLLLLEHPEWKVGALLAITVWAFARAYYFAFYVIEHYVDPNYRFAGLGSFVVYLFKSRKSRDDSQRP
jgi:uncharacterized RDD family membrane protein YckC